MSRHIIQMSAQEVENRLKKAPIFCGNAVAETVNTISCIAVTINHDLADVDGLEVKFKSPSTGVAATRLCVKRNGSSEQKIFAFADANGNDVGEIDNLFAENAIVNVILASGSDIEGVDGVAYVQNADTNAYLEDKFLKTLALQIFLDENNKEQGVQKVNFSAWEIYIRTREGRNAFLYIEDPLNVNSNTGEATYHTLPLVYVNSKVAVFRDYINNIEYRVDGNKDITSNSITSGSGGDVPSDGNTYVSLDVFNQFVDNINAALCNIISAQNNN